MDNGRKNSERAYGEGQEAARKGDFVDEIRHSLGPLFSFGLETDEERAWDAGFADERGEIRSK